MHRLRPLFATCLGLCTIAAFIERAQADAVSDFYRGKTVTIIVGYTAGGGYDLYARALGRHMGRHLPGNPNFIVQNITGFFLHEERFAAGLERRHVLRIKI